MIKKKQERRLCEELSEALLVSSKGVMGDERKSRIENLKGKRLQSLLQSFGPGTQWSEAEEKKDFVTNSPFTHRYLHIEAGLHDNDLLNGR